VLWDLGATLSLLFILKPGKPMNILMKAYLRRAESKRNLSNLVAYRKRTSKGILLVSIQ
jgi:hypothetical protein